MAHIEARLHEIRERPQAAQETMAADANESRRPHDFRTGDRVLLSTAKLPIAYANASSSSRKLQY